MLAVMLVFRFIPPPQGLTAEGLAVIGIFFGILYGWLFIDVVWPSLLGLVLLGLTLRQPMDAVLGSAFGNNTVLLLLFFCMVASIINAAGIAEWGGEAHHLCAVYRRTPLCADFHALPRHVRAGRPCSP